MVISVYAHIMDEDRKVNATKMEADFFAGHGFEYLRSVRPPEYQESSPTSLLTERIANISQALENLSSEKIEILFQLIDNISPEKLQFLTAMLSTIPKH